MTQQQRRIRRLLSCCCCCSPRSTYYALNILISTLLLCTVSNMYSTFVIVCNNNNSHRSASSSGHADTTTTAAHYYSSQQQQPSNSNYHQNNNNNIDEYVRNYETDYRATMHDTKVYHRTLNDVRTANLYELLGSPLVCGEGDGCVTTKFLCQAKPKPKFLKKRLWFQQPSALFLPLANNNSNNAKLIPRIIHQSWFKNITAREHPNLSRIQNSWKLFAAASSSASATTTINNSDHNNNSSSNRNYGSSWEYRYYDDKAASDYIERHFPSEVFEAYRALIPGAFRADFFRYCVLFVEGGVWADIDMQLQINLDEYIHPNDGFIVPLDIDGYALHNALMMSAPGHPVLGHAIEETTNMVRNRYTIVDIAGRYCPNVNAGVLKEHTTLFLTGPGLLGYAMKATYGYPLSIPFPTGIISEETVLDVLLDVDNNEDNKNNNNRNEKESLLRRRFQTMVDPTTKRNHTLSLDGLGGIIPGKTRLLQRIRGDMGETRYTDLDQNVIVAATDIPNGYDRDKDEHYSKTMDDKGRIWGIDKVYKNAGGGNYSTADIADERILFHVLPPPSIVPLLVADSKK